MLTSKKTLKLVSSNGGPFLLLEEHLLMDWHGCFAPGSPLSSTTDYARACQVEGYLGIITGNYSRETLKFSRAHTVAEAAGL